MRLIACAFLALSLAGTALGQPADPGADHSYEAFLQDTLDFYDSSFGRIEVGLTMPEMQAVATARDAERVDDLTHALQRIAAQVGGRRAQRSISTPLTRAFLAILERDKVPLQDWPQVLGRLTQEFLASGARLEQAARVSGGRVKTLAGEADAARRQGRLGDADRLLEEAASRARQEADTARPPARAAALAAAAHLVASRASLALAQLDWLKGARLLQEAATSAEKASAPEAPEWLIESGDAWIRGADDRTAALHAFQQAAELASQESSQGTSQGAAEDPSSIERQRYWAISEERMGDVLLPQQDNEGALKSYRASHDAYARLAAADPASRRWQRELAMSQMSIDFMFHARIAGADPSQSMRSSVEILGRLAAHDPAGAPSQRDLAMGEAFLGDVLQEKGDLAGALQSYERSLAASEKAAAAPDNTALREELDYAQAMNTYDRARTISQQLGVPEPANVAWLCTLMETFADTSRAEGDVSASDTYRRSLQIRQRLAAAEPANMARQRELANTYDKLGASGYQEALAIRQRLAAADPASLQAQRDLAVSLEHIGSTEGAHPEEALKSYEAALAISEKLAAADPANRQGQRELADRLSTLGDFFSSRGEADAALQRYRVSLVIRKRILAAGHAPRAVHRQAQGQVAGVEQRIGDELQELGDPAGALRSYRSSHAILAQLAAADPSSDAAQRELFYSENRIGSALRALGDTAGALRAYQSARLMSAAAARAGGLWRLLLAVPDENAGDTLSAQGDLAGALNSYRASVAILEQLAAEDGAQSGVVGLGLAALENKIGNIQAAQGEWAEALKSYQASLVNSPAWGDLASRLLGYQAELGMRAQLAAAEPSNIALQRELAQYAESAGDALAGLQRRGLGAALAMYEEAIGIRAQLAAADPANTELLQPLKATQSKADAIRQELAASGLEGK